MPAHLSPYSRHRPIPTQRLLVLPFSIHCLKVMIQEPQASESSAVGRGPLQPQGLTQEKLDYKCWMLGSEIFIQGLIYTNGYINMKLLTVNRAAQESFVCAVGGEPLTQSHVLTDTHYKKD